MAKTLKLNETLYGYEELISLHRDPNFNSNLIGKIATDIETGAELKMEELLSTYISKNRDVMSNLRHLPKHIEVRFSKILNSELIKLRKEELLSLLEIDTINKEECEELLILERGKDALKISYESSCIINKYKDKPTNLSDDYYGKFFRLLKLMTYGNTLRHKNSKPISKLDILTYMGIKDRAFETFIKKLKSCNMLHKIDINGKQYITVNPAYANMNIKIDKTLYSYFKDDLDELLSKTEIKYLEFLTGEGGATLTYY